MTLIIHQSQSSPSAVRSHEIVSENYVFLLRKSRALVWITGVVWHCTGVAGWLALAVSFELLAAADETPKKPLTICKFCVRTEDRFTDGRTDGASSRGRFIHSHFHDRCRKERSATDRQAFPTGFGQEMQS